MDSHEEWRRLHPYDGIRVKAEDGRVWVRRPGGDWQPEEANYSELLDAVMRWLERAR